MGEEAYRQWMVERVHETPPVLYLGCLLAQVGLFAAVGGALVLFSRDPTGEDWAAFGIGVGILAYALAVLVFSLISVWRMRRNSRSMSPD